MSMEYNGERFLPEACSGEMAIEHYQRYQFAKQLVKGKTVLDSACGEGYGSSLLAEEAAEVIGLDIDGRVVENANKKYGNSKLSYVAGSVEKLPFEDKTFDVVVSYETIEHVNAEVQNCFLKEISRVLKPDGVLIMSTPNKAVYTDLVKGKNEFHVKEFYVPEYMEFLKGNFKNIEVFCQYPSTGYFIARPGEVLETEICGAACEKSRYIIAVCSNRQLAIQMGRTEQRIIARFDDTMYYFLNEKVHELDEKMLKTKTEADEFEARQEKAIKEQKDYIEHLERDIAELKAHIEKLEKDTKRRLR